MRHSASGLVDGPLRQGRPELAKIEKQPSNDDGIAEYRVTWRCADTAQVDSRTFGTYGEARRWRALLELFWHRWPPAPDLIRHGFGHLALSADESAAAVPQQVAVIPHKVVGSVGARGGSDEGAAAGWVTLERYAREHVDRLVKPSRETRRKYLERLSRYVFPELGDRPLVTITRRIMREWQQGMLADGLSVKTIRNVRGDVLYPMFEASCLPGEDDEPALRSYNPLKGLPLPERDSVERDILDTKGEVSLFLGCAYEVDEAAAELILTALASGMRWGELAGLPVRAVHPGRGVITIEQVLVREYHTWAVRRRPKTRDGYREIPVPSPVLDVLVRRCHGREPDAFVFTGPQGNPWRYSQFYDGRWEKIRDLAIARGLGKRMTIHGLRHSTLTHLATEGIDPAALKQMAGHKRISTTYDIYVHANRKHHPAVRALLEPLAAVPDALAHPRDQRGS